MNIITNQQSQIIAKDAELQAMRDGMLDLIRYLESPKFATGDLAGYVNVSDVVIRIRDAQSAATAALDAANLNEYGPPIADGSHKGCTHGTAAGVPRVNGWHCRVCSEPLPGEWNDTDTRAAARMHKHWVATHRIVAACLPCRDSDCVTGTVPAAWIVRYADGTTAPACDMHKATWGPNGEDAATVGWLVGPIQA